MVVATDFEEQLVFRDSLNGFEEIGVEVKSMTQLQLDTLWREGGSIEEGGREMIDTDRERGWNCVRYSYLEEGLALCRLIDECLRVGPVLTVQRVHLKLH